MMPIVKQRHSGFTAVELLITLFIAALFLAAGYQLFNLVIRDSGAARAESTVANVAYDYLRRYSDSATTLPCAPTTPLSSQAITIANVATPTVTVAVSCPQSSTTPSLNKVEVSITYSLGSETNTVKYATYVDKSKGASPATDITNGLVARWRMNGNANTDVGPNTGTANATTSATGQNGQANSGLAFNGSSSYIQVPLTSFPKPTNAFTISGWFRLLNLGSVQRIASTTETGGWTLMVDYPARCMYVTVYTGATYRPVCTATNSVTTNTWTFGAGVYDGSTVKVYLNNQTAVSAAATGGMTWPANAAPLCIGAESTASGCSGDYLYGTIDDVRFYDRALSATEILQLYNGGAK